MNAIIPFGHELECIRRQRVYEAARDRRRRLGRPILAQRRFDRRLTLRALRLTALWYLGRRPMR